MTRSRLQNQPTIAAPPIPTTNAGHRTRPRLPDNIIREQEYEVDVTEATPSQIPPQLQLLLGWMYPFHYLSDDPVATLKDPWQNNVELFLLLERLNDPALQKMKINFETLGIPTFEKFRFWAASVVSQPLFEIKYDDNGQAIPFWYGLTTEIDNRNMLHNIGNISPNVAHRTLTKFFHSSMGMDFWNEKSRALTNFVIEYFHSLEKCKFLVACGLAFPALALSALTFAISQCYDLFSLILPNAIPLFFLVNNYYPMGTPTYPLTLAAAIIFCGLSAIFDILHGTCRDEEDQGLMAERDNYACFPFFIKKTLDAGIGRNLIFGLSNKITRLLLVPAAILAQPNRLNWFYAMQEDRTGYKISKLLASMATPALSTVPASAILAVPAFTILQIKASFSALVNLLPALMRLLACDTHKMKDCIGTLLFNSLSLLPVLGVAALITPTTTFRSWDNFAESYGNFLIAGYLCVGIILASSAINIAATKVAPKLFGHCMRPNYRTAAITQIPVFAPRTVNVPPHQDRKYEVPGEELSVIAEEESTEFSQGRPAIPAENRGNSFLI